MKIISQYNVALPDYSLCYLINGDSSGLNESDIIAIDNYMQFFYDMANNHNGHVIINVELIDESYFTWSPPFGLACNCYDASIIIIAS